MKQKLLTKAIRENIPPLYEQDGKGMNSLIGHDFYEQLHINQEMFSEDEIERVNTFDWQEAFPEVFPHDDKAICKKAQALIALLVTVLKRLKFG